MEIQGKPLIEEQYYRELDLAYKDKRHLMSRKAEKVLELLPCSGCHLDVGFGSGFLLSKIRQNMPNLKFYGAEINKGAADFIRNYSAEISDKTLIYDGTSLPFKRFTFDSATCLDVLEHTNNSKALLREIYRVMKPKGRLIITVPNWFDIVAVRFFRRSPEHLQTRTPFTWKRILESSGFKVKFFRSVKFPILDIEHLNGALPIFGMCILLYAEKR